MASVFLTKEQADHQAAVIVPYYVSDGSLPQIKLTFANGTYTSDIYLGSSFTITADTTVQELAYAITSNNLRKIKNGEQLLAFAIKQVMTDGEPHIEVYDATLLLSVGNTEKVWKDNFYKSIFQVENGYLVAKPGFEGGFAYILQQQQSDGSYLNSKQKLECNNSIAASFMTEAAFELAAESYGGYEDVLFTKSQSHINVEPREDTPTPTTPVTITAKVATGQEAQGTVKAGSSAAGATSSVTVEKDTSVQVVATPASGYKFKKWNTGETTATLNLIANADTTVTATFEPDSPTGTVTVTLTSADASQGKVQINTGEVGATATATVQSGAATVIKAIPEAGYTFSKWSDGGLQFERTINPTENVSLTATFEAE